MNGEISRRQSWNGRKSSESLKQVVFSSPTAAIRVKIPGIPCTADSTE